MPRPSLWIVFTALFVFASCQSGAPSQASDTGLKLQKGASAVSPKPAASPREPGLILQGWAGKDMLALMTEADRMQNRQAETRALTGPINQQVTWRNPDTNHSGSIVSVKDRYNATGAYCREFQQAVLLDGIQRKGLGAACQQHDGSWAFGR